MTLPVTEFINKVDLPPALILILIIIPILPNLWAIWHAYRSVFPSTVEKMAWVMVGIFFPVFGGLVYLFYGRKRSSGKVNAHKNTLSCPCNPAKPDIPDIEDESI